MSGTKHKFTGKLWRTTGKGAWHFVTLPAELAAEIRFFSPVAKGFMPVAVQAQIGGSVWKTSVFPDSKSGSFLLAVKKEVRKAEAIGDGDDISVTLRLMG